ncbi:MAG: iron chelate uptake ABC transporter family permease subunit, partial [Porphyromonas sp.]
NYARSVGTNIRLVRRLLIVITSIITGCITAFTGPIAFLGMAVPHFVRLLFRTADHHILVPATILSGSFLLLVCDLLTQAPGHQFVLPINAITSLLGAPVVILVVLGNKRKRDAFK